MIGYNLEEKQKQKKVCPKCNEEIDNKAKFCPNCGTKVSNDAEFYDDCIKEFIKKGTIDEFNSKISELDVEKDSAFIIKNTTIASNIFKFKIIKTIYSRAFAYIKEGNKDLAIYDFADIIKWCDDIFNDKHSNEIIAKENSLDGFYILSLIYKGALLAELEEYDLAIKDLNSYLQIINEYYKDDIDSFKDDIFLAYFYRALSYSMLKDTQRAKLDIDKALELNPNDEDANNLYKAINDENNNNFDITDIIKNIGKKIFS
jgi:tetratricopeptide (TPR) repeat protein